jgi:hypothetical protein
MGLQGLKNPVESLYLTPAFMGGSELRNCNMAEVHGNRN